MWAHLYRIALGPLTVLASRVFATVNPKVRRGLDGRREHDAVVIASASEEHDAHDVAMHDRTFAIHVHAASVGEFEQAKPIIEALRRESRRYRITASFFSPSGYEQQRNYSEIDSASYLPEDRPAHVRRFLDRISPDLVIIIRYDLWPEFVRATTERGVPCVLLCATLRANSPRMWPVARGFFGWLYGRLSLIACVVDSDRDAFQRLAPDVPIRVCGDTRYDRVVERATIGARSLEMISRQQFGDGLVVVAGSTWEPDEVLLASLANDDTIRLVIVPHEPAPSHIAALRQRFVKSILLSELRPGIAIPRGTSLIVDRTGVLLGLYALGDIAYVGGGFGAGVHSVLEPAAYGIPVLAGPGVDRSRDASALRDEGLLTIVATVEQCRDTVLSLKRDEEVRMALGARTGQFVRERAGATSRIIRLLREHSLIPESSQTDSVNNNN
ncbi:MAG: hypothetical protein H7X80_07545 [bacterium]|nr:hypothetical protein [Candidatus Kapabacteria bacterium]